VCALERRAALLEQCIADGDVDNRLLAESLTRAEAERDEARAALDAIRTALDTEATMDDPRTPRERVIDILERT